MKIERSSANVFADFGRSVAESHLLKTKLATRIGRNVHQRRINLLEPALVRGLSQPHVSRVLRESSRSSPRSCFCVR